MSILAINLQTTGLVGQQIEPRRCTMITTDSLATITTAGYLNSQIESGAGTIFPTDIFEVLYDFVPNTNVGTFGIFQVTYNSSTGFTLNLWENPGNVLLPVTAGNIAVFANTAGQITSNPSSAPVTAINFGNIHAGASAVPGSFVSFPTSASKGSFRFQAVDNVGNTSQTFSHVAMDQATTFRLTDPGASIAYISTSSFNTSGTQPSCIVKKDINILFSELAGGFHFPIQLSTGSQQWQVRDIKVNYGTGLSGGGGDRLLRITDGTTVWNNAGITAALLGTPVNTIWSGTGNPLPASGTSMSTLSQPGASIYAAYSGGTADYTAGAILLTVELQRVV